MSDFALCNKTLRRVVQGFNHLFQIGDFNPACTGHGALRFVGGFMPEHSINPEFADMEAGHPANRLATRDLTLSTLVASLETRD